MSQEERRRFLEIVERNARRLQRVVDDLLFVARLEAGKLELQESEIDLSRTAKESVEVARPQADGAGIALQEEIAKGLCTHGDGDRLGQAMDNLLSNAIKFTPAGGAVGLRLFSTDGHSAPDGERP